jgi:hypothetical protein
MIEVIVNYGAPEPTPAPRLSDIVGDTIEVIFPDGRIRIRVRSVVRRQDGDVDWQIEGVRPEE